MKVLQPGPARSRPVLGVGALAIPLSSRHVEEIRGIVAIVKVDIYIVVTVPSALDIRCCSLRNSRRVPPNSWAVG